MEGAKQNEAFFSFNDTPMVSSLMTNFFTNQENLWKHLRRFHAEGSYEQAKVQELVDALQGMGEALTEIVVWAQMGNEFENFCEALRAYRAKGSKVQELLLAHMGDQLPPLDPDLHSVWVILQADTWFNWNGLAWYLKEVSKDYATHSLVSTIREDIIRLAEAAPTAAPTSSQ